MIQLGTVPFCTVEYCIVGIGKVFIGQNSCCKNSLLFYCIYVITDHIFRETECWSIEHYLILTDDFFII